MKRQRWQDRWWEIDARLGKLSERFFDLTRDHPHRDELHALLNDMMRMRGDSVYRGKVGARQQSAAGYERAYRLEAEVKAQVAKTPHKSNSWIAQKVIDDNPDKAKGVNKKKLIDIVADHRHRVDDVVAAMHRTSLKDRQK